MLAHELCRSTFKFSENLSDAIINLNLMTLSFNVLYGIGLIDVSDFISLFVMQTRCLKKSVILDYIVSYLCF